MTEAKYQKILSSLKGTFAIEDMKLSKETLCNLHRIAIDNVDYEVVLQEIKDKYRKQGEQ